MPLSYPSRYTDIATIEAMPTEPNALNISAQPAQEAAIARITEQQLEDLIASTPQALSGDWMIIGRQEWTDTGGRIDLLAIAPDSSLVLIELKRNRTPREIVAQALDYAAWVEQLTPEHIRLIYQRFANGESLEDAFKQFFGFDLDVTKLNNSHQIVIVASEIDDSSERIIAYLNARNIVIKVLYFHIREDAASQHAPQIQPLKKLARVLQELADRDHCVFASSDLAGAVPECCDLNVLLSRATKAGLLRRVCKGIYLYPVRDYPVGNLLYHAAARLRASEFNYLSLETVLSEAGMISQVPINWISLMTSGRSHVVDCGDYGHIEFVHTAQRPGDIAAELVYDADCRLWKASVRQALRDMRATRRSMDLVDLEVANEFV
jgi:hypothetical protein